MKDTANLFDLIIDTGAFQYDDVHPFHLTSGNKTSPYYFDMKLLCGYPPGIHAAASVLYNRIKKIPNVGSVGGLESGSISIATAISQLSHLEHIADNNNPEISSFFVRKSLKRHGTKNLIEGVMTPVTVIIDDVITTGASALAAIHAVRESESICKSLMSLVFRGNEHDKSNIEKVCKLESIFYQDQFIEHHADQLRHPDKQ